MSLELALHRLLHRREAREALARGELASFGLDDEDEDALAAIDLAHLEAAATVVRESVFTRSHRGTGTLLDAFPQTIRGWRDRHPGAPLDALAAAFLASGAYEAHRALPTAAGRLSLEEAFFRFMDADAGAGATDASRLELAHAILRALVVTPAPTFALPDFVRRAPRGFFAVVGPEPTLIAALDRRLVTGRISPFLSALLSRGTAESVDEIAGRHAVSTNEARASERELRELGLVT